MSTTPWPLTPGARPVPVQDGAQPPAGLILINPGDGGGPIIISAGPNGPTTPLTAGGVLTWRDVATYPYASLPAGATTAERLLVSDQMTDYSNPVATATATATQLAASGLPGTYLESVVYTTPAAGPTLQPGGASVGLPTPLPVSPYSSLLLTVRWAPKTGSVVNGAAVLALTWQPRTFGAPSVVQYLTQPCAVDLVECTWVLPVLMPGLSIGVPVGSVMAATVTVVGTNRPAPPAMTQTNSGMGVMTLTAVCPTAGAAVLLSNYAPNPPPGAKLTRANGPVKLMFIGPAGTLTASWIDEGGQNASFGFPMTGNASLDWVHPRVPVSWSFTPSAANATVYLAVLGT